MAYITWKDGFNTGINEMDQQHQLFASYMNELYDALHFGNAVDIVSPILDKLTNYSQSHFAAKEAILKTINHPTLNTQIKQHAYFVSELISMKGSVMNKTQTAQNMLLFLKDWLIHYITTEDAKYLDTIKSI